MSIDEFVHFFFGNILLMINIEIENISSQRSRVLKMADVLKVVI